MFCGSFLCYEPVIAAFSTLQGFCFFQFVGEERDVQDLCDPTFHKYHPLRPQSLIYLSLFATSCNIIHNLRAVAPY